MRVISITNINAINVVTKSLLAPEGSVAISSYQNEIASSLRSSQ